mgnify:FL=1
MIIDNKVKNKKGEKMAILKTLEKKIQKELAEVDKQLRTIKSEKFACIPDTEIAKRKLLKKSLYHEVKQINLQFVESKSDTDFPDEVQVQIVDILPGLKARENNHSLGSRWAEKLTMFMIDAFNLLWGEYFCYAWGKTDERIEIAIKNEKEKQTYYGALDY